MSSTITIGANTYTLIALPTNVGPRQMSITMQDAIAMVGSPYVPGNFQTQRWPGADAWGAEITLPRMFRSQAGVWRGFLAELRGVLNVFQIGDPLGATPQGAATGAPVCDTVFGGGVNQATSTVLYTRGWTASVSNQLMADDYIQIGYRLYKVCENCNSDSAGRIQIPIWPSLRESPADGGVLTLNNTVGLFRLTNNQRASHADETRLTDMSFKCIEVR